MKTREMETYILGLHSWHGCFLFVGDGCLWFIRVGVGDLCSGYIWFEWNLRRMMMSIDEE